MTDKPGKVVRIHPSLDELLTRRAASAGLSYFAASEQVAEELQGRTQSKPHASCIHGLYGSIRINPEYVEGETGREKWLKEEPDCPYRTLDPSTPAVKLPCHRCPRYIREIRRHTQPPRKQQYASRHPNEIPYARPGGDWIPGDGRAAWRRSQA